jgi:hypothetical protein
LGGMGIFNHEVEYYGLARFLSKKKSQMLEALAGDRSFCIHITIYYQKRTDVWQTSPPI